jgi:hypothetical protein
VKHERAPEVIVKVQVPLFGSSPTTLPLHYERERRHMTTQAISNRVRREIARSDTGVKAYFKAAWIGGAWRVGARVADQDW